METIFLVLALCTASVCTLEDNSEKTLFIMDEFTAEVVEDAQSDCTDARDAGRLELRKVNAGGARLLECRTPAELAALDI
ncbi:hypothetical protein GOD54_23465 [Sinorhizobium medicae]|nr:hypothetical protein [Sinorhizobium medicae]